MSTERISTSASPMSRRKFLAGGEVLVDAALTTTSLAQLGITEAAGPANTRSVVATGTDLDPRRRRIYLALVEALSISDLVPVDGSRAEEVTTELAQRYAGAPLPFRQNIDTILDAVEEGTQPGSFAAMNREERLSMLRSRLTGSDPFSTDSLSNAYLVREAVALAVGPFYPEDHRWDSSSIRI